MLRRLVSWLTGNTIGETRYIAARPHIIGNGFLTLCDGKIKFRMYPERWTGFNWVRGEIMELPKEQWIEILKKELDNDS